MSKPLSAIHGVDFAHGARGADAVRALPMSLPYSRLFGTHFVLDENPVLSASVGRGVRLTQTGRT